MSDRPTAEQSRGRQRRVKWRRGQETRREERRGELVPHV
jgi:hypothetical protein